VEENYMPRLRGVERVLLRLLARGGRIEARLRDPVFAALSDILPETYTPAEVEFYAHYLRDAREVRPGGESGRQALFSRLLDECTDLNGPVTRREVAELMEAARREDEELAHRLERILHLEALLAPADALFDYVLTQNAQRPEEVAEHLHECWGPTVPNLDPSVLREILPEVESASSREAAGSISACHTALAAGKYDEAIRSLLSWNAVTMAARKAGPWATLSETGRIDVRYRGAEHLLPEEDELPTLWRNSYFFDSLKNITRQLKEVA